MRSRGPLAKSSRSDAGGRSPVLGACVGDHGRGARGGRGPAAIEVLEEGGLIDGKEYRGRRVSLDFKDVAIADVLRLIAEVSDLNIIAGDEVSGNVTIRLVEVPWDQALDVILMTKGLGFVRVGNVLRIAPADVLKAEEEVRLQERRNKEKLEDLEVKLLPVNYAAVKDIETSRAAAALVAGHREPRQAHQHVDHQGHQLRDRRGERADRGDRYPERPRS